MISSDDEDDEHLYKNKEPNSFKIILYLGDTRPSDSEDYGLKLLLELERNNYNVAAIIIKESDPINLYPAIKLKKRLFIPEALTLIKPKIEEMLNDAESSREVSIWLDKIGEIDADLGIIFYGNWLPPRLFNIPKLGFINYHPGPLPFLKGMEPDTFIILEGWRKVWGAVHKVEANFDTGYIITKSRPLMISKYSTPIEVLVKLTNLGVEAIIRALKKILNNEPHYKLKEGSAATVARAKKESTIFWDRDSNDIIDRKLRAFCGQDIKIRLKASIDNKLYFIYDLETYNINDKYINNQKAGTLLGYYLSYGKYYLKPIVKTIDGVAILFADEDNGISESDILFSKEMIIAPLKRKHETNHQMIKESIIGYKNLNKI